MRMPRQPSSPSDMSSRVAEPKNERSNKLARGFSSQDPKLTIGLPTAVGLTLLFLLKTAILINDSYLFGRLALPPVYDDVSYFVDALQRIDVFRAAGLRGVIAGLIASPPHAPYSTLAAFVSFMVSGDALAAPYVMNALAVVAFTLLWLVMFRVGHLSAWLIAIMIATTGWFDNAVTIYHPDLIAGYGAAIVATFLIFPHEVLTSTRRRVVVGIVAGLVLLIKPTAFAMVLVLWGVAVVTGLLASRAADGSVLTALRRYAVPFLLLVVIGGPYFALDLPTLLNYLYSGLVSQHSTWIHLSAGLNPWTFFILRTVELFGIWTYVGAASFVIVTIAAMRGSRTLLICLAALVACLGIAYAAPTIVSIQVMLFGSVLYGMFLVTGLIAVIRLAAFLALSGRLAALSSKYRTAAATLLLIVFGFVVAGETKDRQGRFPSGVIAQESAEYNRIYSILREMTVPGQESSTPHHILAFFPTVAVPPHAYLFRALKEGLDLNIDDAPFETDRSHVLTSAKRADIVFIPDGRLLPKYFPYPVNAILGDVVQRLRKDPSMVEGSPLELPGGAMLIFRRAQETGSGAPSAVSVTPGAGQLKAKPLR